MGLGLRSVSTGLAFRVSASGCKAGSLPRDSGLGLGSRFGAWAWAWGLRSVSLGPPFFEHRNSAKNEEQFSGSFAFGPPETANQSAAVCKQFQKHRGSLQETSIII